MRSKVLIAIVALALLVRVGFVLATDYTPAQDAEDYDRIAKSIAGGDGYPPTTYGTPGTASAFRSPGFPYTLGAVYWVSGNDWTAARLFGAALGAVTVLLIFLLGSWLRDRTTGLVAAAIAAVYPPLINISAVLLTEGLFIPLMLGALVAALAYRRSAGSLRWALAAGVLCGLAGLTRQNGLLLLIPCAIAVAGAAAVPRRSRMAAMGLLVLGVALALTPWTIRNANALGAFVPVSTQSGFLAAVTYNSSTNAGTLGFNYSIPGEFSREWPQQDEAEVDRSGRALARRFVSDHPETVPRLMAVMTLRTVDIRRPAALAALQDDELNLTSFRAGLIRVSFWLLVGVTLLAAVVTRNRRAGFIGPWWFWVAPLLLAISTVVFVGSPRYRTALEPFLVLLAGSGLVDVARRGVFGRRLAMP